VNFSLSAEQTGLRDEIVSFARAELNPGAAERDRDQVFSRELWARCGALRLQGLLVPQDYGGRGLDPLSAVLAIEALGYGSSDGGLNFAICAHLLACAVPIWKHGSAEQRQRYLPGMSNGTLIAANAMTEPAAGSDAFALATRATPDGTGFRITGQKTFVSNGPVADLIVAYAATDSARGYHGGVTAFLVPRDSPGVRAGPRVDKVSLRSCEMSDIIFDDAYVSGDAVLGKVGGGSTIFVQSMDWERSCLVALHVGTMERLLEASIAHARTRRLSGQAIGKIQAVSNRIVDMKVRLEAARLLTYRAASLLEGRRDIGIGASITKLFASESLLSTAQDAMRTLGGYGVLAENETERALRDALASTLYSGTSDVQRNIIARWLGL